jgi:hypothetical protein
VSKIILLKSIINMHKILHVPYIFYENLCYRTYVSDVLEFKNTAGIFVPGTNPNSIFGKEPFITPVLAVKFQF